MPTFSSSSSSSSVTSSLISTTMWSPFQLLLVNALAAAIVMAGFQISVSFHSPALSPHSNTAYDDTIQTMRSSREMAINNNNNDNNKNNTMDKSYTIPTKKDDQGNNHDTTTAALAAASVTKKSTTTSPGREVASGPFANLKTLVVIIGSLRGGEKAWQSLRANVLEYNTNTDLALLIGETRSAFANASLFTLAKYVWLFHEYNDWADAMDQINGTAWRQTALPKLKQFRILLGGIQNHDFRGSGAIIFMIRYWLSQKIQHLNLTRVYDRFVITRSDHYYLCPHDLSTLDTNQYLYLPHGETWAGVTDRHLVVGKQFVLPALDILPHMLQHVNDYVAANTISPEAALALRWKAAALPVRKFARVMFTCAVSGDTTRWKKPEKSRGQTKEGVYLKYPLEYAQSKQTCAKKAKEKQQPQLEQQQQ